jgi:hypothetical protein
MVNVLREPDLSFPSIISIIVKGSTVYVFFDLKKIF